MAALLAPAHRHVEFPGASLCFGIYKFAIFLLFPLMLEMPFKCLHVILAFDFISPA